MANSTDAEATLKKFVARINAHDPSGIIALCTTDHVFIDSLGSKLLLLACGFASATHAPSQTTWRIPAAWRARVEDDRIAEWQVYADNKPIYELLSHHA